MDHTGMSSTSVDIYTRFLLRENAIIEDGYFNSSRGKRPVLLKANPDYAYAIGLEIGRIVHGVCIDLGGNMISNSTASFCPTPLQHHEVSKATLGKAIGSVISQLLEAVKAKSISREQVVGLGMGLSAQVSPQSGKLQLSFPVDGQREITLSDLLDLKAWKMTVADNNANTAAWGEYRFGVGRNKKCNVFLFLNRMQGMGIIVDGKIVRGRGRAGEIPHITVEETADTRLCTCGRKGCYAAVGREILLVGEGKGLALDHPESLLYQLVKGKVENLSSELIAEAACKKDKAALFITEKRGVMYGKLCANLITVFDPEILVFNGWCTKMGNAFLSFVSEIAGKYSNKEDQVNCLRYSKLGEWASAIGAAELVFSESDYFAYRKPMHLDETNKVKAAV